MTVDCLLHVKGLKTYFPVLEGTIKAVDGAYLKIDSGEAVGLVGESACGKSTMASSILRLIRPPGRIVEGEILYKQKDITQLREDEVNEIRGKEISMIFQDPMSFLNPTMRVGDQVAEIIRRHTSLNKKEIREKVKRSLEMVLIPSPDELYQYYPFQLSGGMCQRIVIATAIACDPTLLIADEPTTSLDVTVQAQIIDLIKSLKAQLGTSLLLITHDLGLVASLVDIIYIMYAGSIVERADVFTIFENPKHPYTHGLIESVRSLQGLKRNLVAIKGSPPDMLRPPPGCKFYPRCPASAGNLQCGRNSPPEVEIERNHFVSCWLAS